VSQLDKRGEQRRAGKSWTSLSRTNETRSARVSIAGGIYNLSDSPTRYVPSALASSGFIGWSTPRLICDTYWALGRDRPPHWAGDVTNDAWPPAELNPDEAVGESTDGKRKPNRSTYTKTPGTPPAETGEMRCTIRAASSCLTVRETAKEITS
jgi:hypothetical protein